MIMRTLSNNPKVLYGPTETEADRIMENVGDDLLDYLGINSLHS